MDTPAQFRFLKVLALGLGRFFTSIFKGLAFLVVALAIAWAALAIYYSNLPWSWARTTLAIGFVAYAVWAIWLNRGKRGRRVLVGLFVGVVIWFWSIPASHDREWRAEVAVMPRAILDGDTVRLTGVRHFTFRSARDFTERWEEREVSLSHLVSIDFFVSYWKEGPVGHTFLSFNFDNALPLCISIETRPEIGEGFAPIQSLFKQFELAYVVGDERDIVRLRTDHRNEAVFLYRIRTTPEAARELLRVYLRRINELADRAEWYHLLSNSCTINIVRYANAVGRVGGFDWGHLLNGFIDRYLYRSGRLYGNLPFEELRRRSHINEAAKAAGDSPDFSKLIRAGLPEPDRE
jgi:hypothetical protein